LVVGLVAEGRSQPPPVAPNPQAPTLNMPAPLGVQRGVPLDLTLTGANLAGPKALWTGFPAKVTIPTDKNNGKDNGSLRVHLEVPKDAPLGLYPIRLATGRGLSNLRLFCVDDLPQITEVDTNRSSSTAQAVPIPCVVVGRTDAEISDYYKVTVKAGQRVTFEVLGRRLGSGLDAQLSLIDPRTHKELAFSNDAPGLQTDPRITYTFKEAGDYLLELRDTRWAGGGDFYYRLRVGDFPCATTAVPMAAKRGTQAVVNFAGPHVEGVAPVTVAVPADPAARSLWVAPRGANGLYGWPVALGVSDLDEIVEQEPNNEPGKATRIPAPGAVTGRFQTKGDIDHFVFAAKKGQRWLIQAQTHEFSSPTEVYMVLRDAKGAQLGVTNPAVDPQIDFTAPADGDYVLAVEDLIYAGGPEETYRITVKPRQPGFDLTLGIDRHDVPPGGVAAIPIQTVVYRDYNGPIDVSVVGHPGLSGQTVLHPHPPVPNQAAGWLFLAARPDVAPGPSQVYIQGKAMINGKPVMAYASAEAFVKQELAGLPHPPRDLARPVGVAVVAKPPFQLAAKLDMPEAARGLPASVTISAARASGFAEEIALAPLAMPANVAAALKNIPKGQNEVKVQLTAAPAVPLGAHVLGFTGKAKHENVEYVVTAGPVNLVVVLPFDLKIEPVPFKLAPGAKAKIKVSAIRKGGYMGPITLEARNLPANVTATAATIAMGQTAAEIEVTATANAAMGDKGDVNILGTASAAANQQNASPNFTVSVGKK
jgi:hypothetical protein